MPNHIAATVLTLLPPQHLLDSHRLSLVACNLTITPTGDHGYLYVHSVPGVNPRRVTLDRSVPFEDAWSALLEAKGLSAYASDPFIDTLRRCMRHGDLDWSCILQLALNDMPVDAVPHIDVQGSTWADDTRPAEFGGFACRITRETVHWHQTHDSFFRRLDLLAAERQRPVASRVERLVEETLSPTTGLVNMLRQLFPERRPGEPHPHQQRDALKAALRTFITAWLKPTR